MKRTARMTFVNILLGAALAASLLSFPAVGHAEEVALPPGKARAMTAAELHMLYADKSWKWSDGAGRMDAENRRFSAISGSGEQSTWAVGRWSVTDAGRLCFIADWHSQSGIVPSRTCFLHMVDDETIYQRKEPSGGWYIFKHPLAQPDDEYKKLVREDLVSAELAKRQLSKRSAKKP